MRMARSGSKTRVRSSASLLHCIAQSGHSMELLRHQKFEIHYFERSGHCLGFAQRRYGLVQLCSQSEERDLRRAPWSNPLCSRPKGQHYQHVRPLLRYLQRTNIGDPVYTYVEVLVLPMCNVRASSWEILTL